MTNPYEEKLAQFVEDTVMYQAVKQILETQFDLNVKITSETPSAQAFDLVRAVLDGRELLKNGFKEIEKYRRQEIKEKDKINPAL